MKFIYDLTSDQFDNFNKIYTFDNQSQKKIIAKVQYDVTIEISTLIKKNSKWTRKTGNTKVCKNPV